MPAPRDRRARIITVTEAGRDAARIGQRIVDRVHAEVLGAVPAARRRVFVDVLRHLSEVGSPSPKDLDPPRLRRRREIPSPK